MKAAMSRAPRAILRLSKKLYRAEAIALAVETVTAQKTVQVHWRRAGSDSHHELVISGQDAPRRADELAQVALEQTIAIRKSH